MGYQNCSEQKRVYQRNWIAQRRAEYLGEMRCNQCGSADQLEFDHVDASEKALPASRLWSMSDRNPRKLAELAKLQVLCRDCHLGKTYGEAEHGTRRMYKRGCHCLRCRGAENSYRRELHAKNKCPTKVTPA